MENKILEWRGVKPEDEKLAQKVAKKVGELYFTYNLPLQVYVEFNEDGKPESGISIENSTILNYMPRKERCELLTFGQVFENTEYVAAQDVKDFMKVSALVLEHLAEQFKKLDPAKDPEPYVYYPNCQ